MEEEYELDEVGEEWASFSESILDSLPEQADEIDLTTFYDWLIDVYELSDEEAIDMLYKHVKLRISYQGRNRGYLH